MKLLFWSLAFLILSSVVWSIGRAVITTAADWGDFIKDNL